MNVLNIIFWCIYAARVLSGFTSYGYYSLVWTGGVIGHAVVVFDPKDKQMVKYEDISEYLADYLPSDMPVNT